MNETDTTVQAENNVEGGGQPQPDAPTEQAEATEQNTQPDQNGEVDAGEKPEDINLEWLSKTKGVNVDDPKAVAEAWRKAEQEFHKSRQETKALQEQAVEAVRTGDPSVDRLAVLEARVTVRDFYDAHPDARAMDDKMAEIV